jgi:hypothetical protein
MTVNLYIGAGTENITALDPTDPNYLVNLVTAVTGVYYEIQASQPPVRMQGVADQVVDRMPDVFAVEEATLLRIQSPGDIVQGGTTPATVVVYDYLQLLVDALQARGAHYAVAATSVEWDIEMPMFELGLDGNPTGVMTMCGRRIVRRSSSGPICRPASCGCRTRRAVTSRICWSTRRWDSR